MDIIKKHIGGIIFPVIAAIIGAACGIVPYFAIASIMTQLIDGTSDYRVFVPCLRVLQEPLSGIRYRPSVHTTLRSASSRTRANGSSKS